MNDGFKSDDVITMRLNAKSRALSFSKNGKDYRPIEKDPNPFVAYRIFVFLNEKGDQIELTRFDKTYVP